MQDVVFIGRRHPVKTRMEFLLGQRFVSLGIGPSSLSELFAPGYQSPRLVVVDVLGLLSTSADFLPRLSANPPNVLVVGLREDEDAMIAAWNEGIPAHLLEDLNADTLAHMRGHDVGTSRLYDYLGRRTAERVHSFLARRWERQALTEQEGIIVGLLRQGRRNADIAGELGIEPKTVKNHLTRIYQKLGAAGRYQLLARSPGYGSPPRSLTHTN